MKTSLRNRLRLSLVLGALLLGACSKGPAPAASATAAPPAATPELQALYDSSCRSCHSLAASGAPQLGDAQAWAPRLAQGRETLLNHAINGYKSMPPMGGCMQCSEEDFAALIAYMAGQPL